MVRRVISGGQTGADQGGLAAAKECKIETGGWAPKGFRTLKGYNLKLGELFGLKEHKSSAYPPRTYANVRDSDGTIRFAKSFDSPGELCTLKALKQYGKQYFDVDVNKPPLVEDVVDWIYKNQVRTLNIAGNSTKTAPGIGRFVKAYLIKVFKEQYN